MDRGLKTAIIITPLGQVDGIAFRQMLTWAAGLDRHRIEQKGCIMPTPDYFGFDIDRFCWTLVHEDPTRSFTRTSAV